MHRKLLIGTLAATAGILVLVFGTARPARIYSVGLHDFLAADFSDRPVRVRGALIRGSLCQVTANCGYRFRLQERPLSSAAGTARSPAPKLSVSYDGCRIPDTFRDEPAFDADVLVEGERCKSCHDFKAERILARTYGKYEMRLREPPKPVPPIPRCRS